MKNQYKVGSLFAGVGGICQGFKDANCDVVWANEFDKRACETYKLNHLSVNLIEGDVKEISKNNLSDIDILTAGFPCQPFSQAGHGTGFDDNRGQLFYDVIRLLKELKPKAYLLENVRTLATHDDKKSFQIIKEELIDAGYSFIPFILNASKYVDIPQGRERIYLVGFKNENEYFFNEPIKTNIKDIKVNLSSSFKIPEKAKQALKNVSDFLDSSSVLTNDIYNKLDNEIHKRVIESVKKSNTVYQYRRYYVRENKSNVCPTLTANMGGGGHNVPIVLDGDFPRRLTPKECFNLQGFPVDFKLPETFARGQLYKQAGNSVVVPMIKIIAQEIVRVLDENRNS